jgi:hypothetical protein
MKTPARKELIAMQRAEAVADGEMFRWELWEAIDPISRMRAIGVAGLPRERAADPMAKFTDDERARIRSALMIHVSRMEFIVQLMAASNTTRQGYLH